MTCIIHLCKEKFTCFIDKFLYFQSQLLLVRWISIFFVPKIYCDVPVVDADLLCVRGHDKPGDAVHQGREAEVHHFQHSKTEPLPIACAGCRLTCKSCPLARDPGVAAYWCDTWWRGMPRCGERGSWLHQPWIIFIDWPRKFNADVPANWSDSCPIGHWGHLLWTHTMLEGRDEDWWGMVTGTNALSSCDDTVLILTWPVRQPRLSQHLGEDLRGWRPVSSRPEQASGGGGENFEPVHVMIWK